MKGEISALARHIGNIAVKDPRFCLTLPHWRANANITDCVVVIRHPKEVMLSLRRRQKVPQWLGFRFWEYHMANLLSALPSKYLMVDHGTLIGEEPGAELARVALFFGYKMSTEELLKRFHSTYSPGLIHVKTHGEDEVPRRTHDLWLRAVQLRNQQLTI
jgi:hypothetical protein